MRNNRAENHEALKTMTNQAPIKTNKKPTEKIKELTKTNEKPQEVQDISSPQLNNFNCTKKAVYRNFLKLLKQHKAISAIGYADVLGVTRQTISKWLDSPLASRILSEDLDYHFSLISDAKDWKAHAYLIDTAKGKQDITNIQVNTLEGLTIIRR